METSGNISLAMAFLAGIGAFFTPCVFPLIPSYISYLTGLSFGELAGRGKAEEIREMRLRTALHSLSFILGFTIVFVTLGIMVNFMGTLVFQDRLLMKKIAGAFIIFFGLVIMKAVKLPFLEREKKISYKKENISVAGSILVGGTFALAWSPCLGPFIASVLAYVSGAENLQSAASALIAFSLGLGVPFFVSALAINFFVGHLRKASRHLRKIEIASGVVLIVFGAFILMGGI